MLPPRSSKFQLDIEDPEDPLNQGFALLGKCWAVVNVLMSRETESVESKLSTILCFQDPSIEGLNSELGLSQLSTSLCLLVSLVIDLSIDSSITMVKVRRSPVPLFAVGWHPYDV